MTRALTERLDLLRMRRFATASVVTVAVQAGIVIGLIAVGLDPQIALVAGLGIATIVHFTVNRQWVFADEGTSFHLHLSRQGLAYLLLALFNYLASALALALLPDSLRVSPALVYMGTTLVLGVNNYLWLGKLVFKQGH